MNRKKKRRSNITVYPLRNASLALKLRDWNQWLTIPLLIHICGRKLKSSQFYVQQRQVVGPFSLHTQIYDELLSLHKKRKTINEILYCTARTVMFRQKNRCASGPVKCSFPSLISLKHAQTMNLEILDFNLVIIPNRRSCFGYLQSGTRMCVQALCH